MTFTAEPLVYLDATDDEEEWMAARRSGITATDAATILGLSSFTSPYALWESKVRGSRRSSGEAAYWGTKLEEPIAQEFAQRHGVSLLNPRILYRHPEHEWLRCTPDRFIMEPEWPVGLVECKTAGLRQAHKWDDGVPLNYVAQVIVQQAVTGLTDAHVAVLIGGQEYRDYQVEYDQTVVDEVIAKLHAWYHRHLLGGEPPGVDDSEATAEALKARYSLTEKGTVIELGEEVLGWIDRYRLARQSLDNAKREVTFAENAIVAMLQGNEVGTVGGEAAVTRKMVRSSRIDLDDLREKYPEVAKDVGYTTQFPRLRVL